MYAVMGATGQVGSVVVDTLLARGERVRAVVRSAERGAAMAARGAELAVSDATSVKSLTQAFTGAEGVFVLNPPAFASPDMFAACKEVCRALVAAIEGSGAPRVVALSSIGAQLPSGTGNIGTDHLLEESLRGLAAPVTSVRGAWFMENWAGMLDSARADGVMPSLLTPFERAIPQVSAADMGRVCAEAMVESRHGQAVIEVEGPEPYSPVDVAAAFAAALGREVVAVPVPEDQWTDVFLSMGNSPRNAEAWIELIHAVNSGHLAFEGGHRHVRGELALAEVIAGLVDR